MDPRVRLGIENQEGGHRGPPLQGPAMTFPNDLRGWTILGCCVLACGCLNDKREEASKRNWNDPVHQFGEKGVAIVPTQQVLTPAGVQVELPGMRSPGHRAFSPDGQLLITSGKTPELVVLDPGTGAFQATRPTSGSTRLRIDGTTTSARNLLPDKGAELSFTGLIFSPDGRHIFLSSVGGTVKVFDVADDHNVIARADRSRSFLRPACALASGISPRVWRSPPPTVLACTWR